MKPAEPPTLFPDLDGKERACADAWLHDYLRLIIRLHRDLTDDQRRALSTGDTLTTPEVLARSVRTSDRPFTNLT